jgi:ABC-2 type transport system permease protein
MNAFLAVIRKELTSVLRDRTMVIAIIIQLFIASFSSALLLGLLALYDPDTVMQYSGSAVQVGLVSASNTPLQAFLSARGVSNNRYASLTEAEQAFYQGQINAILVVPPATDGLEQLQMYLSDNDFTPIIRTVLQSPLKQYENTLRTRGGVLVRYTNLAGKPATAFEFIYSILLPMLMFFPAFVAGSMVIDSLTEEVENNTLQTLLSAPLSINGIVNAKISAAVSLALIQCSAWLGLLWMNHISIQNPLWVLFMAVIVAGITATGAGLVAVLFRDRERAQFIYSLALLAAFAISTLLGLSPVQTISRLAIGDYYTSGWNVAILAAFLAALWLLLTRLAHRLVR